MFVLIVLYTLIRNALSFQTTTFIFLMIPFQIQHLIVTSLSVMGWLWIQWIIADALIWMSYSLLPLWLECGPMHLLTLSLDLEDNPNKCIPWFQGDLAYRQPIIGYLLGPWCFGPLGPRHHGYTPFPVSFFVSWAWNRNNEKWEIGSWDSILV